MLTGVPAYVDGRMLAITEAAGGAVVNRDRMWHYVEGVRNWDPVWPGHAIRILAGPSAMWFDGRGNRLPAPYFPGFDTLGTLDHLQHTGSSTRGSSSTGHSPARSSRCRGRSRTST
jgi:predicted oxidoreductase